MLEGEIERGCSAYVVLVADVGDVGEEALGAACVEMAD